jgi:hypothetical protein
MNMDPQAVKDHRSGGRIDAEVSVGPPDCLRQA